LLWLKKSPQKALKYIYTRKSEFSDIFPAWSSGMDSWLSTHDSHRLSQTS
jgi:hypothetical protein